MQIRPLHVTPSAIPDIADWYFSEWGHFNPDLKQADIADSLQKYLTKDELPQALVAIDNNTPIGVAEIKYRELSLYPQFEHWLGGVFVKPAFRGSNVASELVKKSLNLSSSYGIKDLYLQSLHLDGGLYSRYIRPVGNRTIRHYRSVVLLIVRVQNCIALLHF